MTSNCSGWWSLWITALWVGFLKDGHCGKRTRWNHQHGFCKVSLAWPTFWTSFERATVDEDRTTSKVFVQVPSHRLVTKCSNPLTDRLVISWVLGSKVLGSKVNWRSWGQKKRIRVVSGIIHCFNIWIKTSHNMDSIGWFCHFDRIIWAIKILTCRVGTGIYELNGIWINIFWLSQDRGFWRGELFLNRNGVCRWEALNLLPFISYLAVHQCFKIFFPFQKSAVLRCVCVC